MKNITEKEFLKNATAPVEAFSQGILIQFLLGETQMFPRNINEEKIYDLYLFGALISSLENCLTDKFMNDDIPTEDQDAFLEQAMMWEGKISSDEKFRTKIIKQILKNLKVGVSVRSFNQRKSLSKSQIDFLLNSIVLDFSQIFSVDHENSTISKEEAEVVNRGYWDFKMFKKELELDTDNEINYLVHQSVVHDFKNKIIDIGLEQFYQNEKAKYSKKQTGCLFPVIFPFIFLLFAFFS
jgi:hypothetical protein